MYSRLLEHESARKLVEKEGGALGKGLKLHPRLRASISSDQEWPIESTFDSKEVPTIQQSRKPPGTAQPRSPGLTVERVRSTIEVNYVPTEDKLKEESKLRATTATNTVPRRLRRDAKSTTALSACSSPKGWTTIDSLTKPSTGSHTIQGARSATREAARLFDLKQAAIKQELGHNKRWYDIRPRQMMNKYYQNNFVLGAANSESLMPMQGSNVRLFISRLSSKPAATKRNAVLHAHKQLVDALLSHTTDNIGQPSAQSLSLTAGNSRPNTPPNCEEDCESNMQDDKRGNKQPAIHYKTQSQLHSVLVRKSRHIHRTLNGLNKWKQNTVVRIISPTK